jgi:hypothetical protein
MAGPASTVAASGGVAAPASAIVSLPNDSGQDACKTTVLSANDDGSTGLVPLPFNANFFGNTFSGVYVNNNGNVTFDAPLGTYTPFNLLSTQQVIVAPFFADIDTRGLGSDVVHYSYGDATYNGRPAFCVDWVNVGYYSGHTDKLNSVQLLLVDRSDVGAGDFDIIMNYDQIQWEAGDASGGSGGLGGSPARVGYSNGSTRSFEVPGSGFSGAFLDSNTETGLIHHSRDSVQPGRYTFQVRSGEAPVGGTLSGRVYANTVAPANALFGAFVQVCSAAGDCHVSTTDTSGQYLVSGLAGGQYTVTAFPPGSSTLLQGTIGPLTLGSGLTLANQDVVLTGPTPPPAGTTITNRGTGAGGLPVVYWGEPLLTTQGCAGATAGYQVLQDGHAIRSGLMAEGPAGTYTATIPSLAPIHGNAHVEITLLCANGTTTTIPFDIYIDPSGVVQTVTGVAVPGATVTLYRSDSATGPFTLVPDGSGIMSIANRHNPDTTDTAGHFGWDVIAGYYIVRAARAGCVSATDPTQTVAESAVMTIPPAVTDVDLRLSCPPGVIDPPITQPGATPELSSIALFGSGFLGLAGYAVARQRARRKQLG